MHDVNGEYSGQNCLFMPQPQFWRDHIFAPFFAVFRGVFAVGKYAVVPKCDQIGKNYLKHLQMGYK